MTGWRKRQVLELALEALETAEIDGNCEYGATEIIRKALAQPEQRTWVDLTDEETDDIIANAIDKVDALIQTVDKLKEKNT